jgi:hypothetical protein
MTYAAPRGLRAAKWILELYGPCYSVPAMRYMHVTTDYQLIKNPGYNRQHGPVPSNFRAERAWRGA